MDEDGEGEGEGEEGEEVILPDIEKRRVKEIFVMECSSFYFFTSTHQKKPQLIQSS